GTSRGIGKALTIRALSLGYKVIGLSRTNGITHANFEFRQIDLADLEQVKNFHFSEGGDETILVNNAGILGEINAVGKIPNDIVHKVMNVNIITPQILSNNFIRQFSAKKGNFLILNISS